MMMLIVFVGQFPLHAEQRVLDAKLHHLRIDGPREWTEFPETPDADSLVVKFETKANAGEQTLSWRQQDLKQSWKVSLNGRDLGRLVRDENDMVVYRPVPAGTLRSGVNELKIEQLGRRGVDDIRVGAITLDDRPMQQALMEATVEIQVTDSATSEPIPCRITVLNEAGALMTVGAESNDEMAVRPGIVYCGHGRASFGLPAGRYTVFAGRGFEWGIASKVIELRKGYRHLQALSIRREVPTEGYVACDTHVHTVTHSGHGDATIAERMLTLAGEGIELPIATDHNIHIDYGPIARKLRVRKYFTPVIGNEVTTKVGHFNVFPIQVGADIPNFRLSDWKSIFESIYASPRVKAVILNHARDLHSGVRPFGPKLHNAVTGENLEGWKLRANAMELVNSGATQSDVMRLYRDWFGLLNRGLAITPVGSSDSHDVGRHFVGQGRTYIRCDDEDPSAIDVDVAVRNFVQGRVMVSYGLLAEISVNGKFGPGELAPRADSFKISVRVLGPSWVTAETVELYANGHKVREVKIADGRKAGVKWSGKFTFENLTHDVHLVAIARGPGVKGLYWATAKSYQPTTPDWRSYVIGSTGAAWLDVDGDGKRTSAHEYATRLVKTADNDVPKLLGLLKPFDQSVAAQSAGLVHAAGAPLLEPGVRAQIKKSADATQRGFDAYLSAWRESQIARSRSN